MENTQLASAEGQASALPPATGSSRLNVGAGERIASVIGGTALAVYALRNMNKISGKVLAGVSLMLLKRGVTGHCEVNQAVGRNSAKKSARAMEVRASYSIPVPKDKLYAFWRNFSNLPQFMDHLESVKVIDQNRSTWTAKLPGGVGTVSWEATVIEEEPNNRISWTSLPGSTIDNAGEVRFSDSAELSGGNGTRVDILISYRLPAGDLGSVAAKLFNPMVEDMVQKDLQRFRNLMDSSGLAYSTTSADASSTLNSLVD